MQEKREIEPIMQKEENLEIPTISKKSKYKVENVKKNRIVEKAEPVIANGDSLETTNTFTNGNYKAEKAMGNNIGENTEQVTANKVSPNTPVPLKDDELRTTLSIGEKEEEKVGSIKVKEEASETPLVFKDNGCKIEEILHDRTPKTELATEEDDVEELKIGGSRFWINFPPRLIQQAKYSDHEQCVRLAGTIAAQTLKKNPQLARSLSADPVPVWSEIKSFVLDKFAQKIKS